MLCKFKGSRKFYTRFTAPSGKRICRSTGTENRKQAQEYEDKLREKYWRAYRMGQVRRTWEEAVESYLLGKDDGPILWHLEILDEFCRNRYLDDLSHVRDSVVKSRLSKGIKKHKANGVTPSSVNKTLALFRGIMLHASEKGWIPEARVKLLPEPKRRVRWLTRDEADRLMDELPEHLKDAVRLALATGLREQNVRCLTWDRVDLERRVCWVEAEDHKNGEPHVVPLNAEAMLALRRRQGKEKTYVFGYKGRRLFKLNNHGWKSALRRAGITNFRFHDLRHTWASWHVQNGTPLPVLQKLGGWKTLAMVLRYSHLGQSHVAEYADNICRPRIIGKELADGDKSGPVSA